MSEEFGTPSKFLHHRDGPETSKAAAEEVDTAGLEQAVLSVIKTYGEEGCISTQLTDHFTELPYSITQRYSGLERKGHIYYMDDTRKGGFNRQQRVIRANRRTSTRRYFGDERRTPKEKPESSAQIIERLLEEIKQLRERLDA